MRFIARSIIRTTPARLFAFHELPDAVDRLMPPWERARVFERAPDLHPGRRAVASIRLFFGVSMRIESVHTVYEPPFRFEDEQLRGPFRRWHHTHIIEPHPDGAVLIDDVDFEPPFALISGWIVKRRLRRLFEYRHCMTREWCERADSAKIAS